jgi:hypothetical protein
LCIRRSVFRFLFFYSFSYSFYSFKKGIQKKSTGAEIGTKYRKLADGGLIKKGFDAVPEKPR